MISLATVAAFVVNEGLGAPIFAAIQRRFKTELIAAGVLAVALALLADALLVARAARSLTPWARAGGDAMNDFVDAFTFIGDNLSTCC